MDLKLGLVIAAVISLYGWFIKSYLAESRKARERLWPERRNLYMKFQDPFIRFFHGVAVESQEEQDKALKEITSYEFRQTAFEVVLISSDEMVNTYNEFMRKTYEGSLPGASKGASSGLVLLEIWSRILLAIRKDIVMKTKLGNWDMVRWMITDIDNYLDDNDKLIQKMVDKLAEKAG